MYCTEQMRQTYKFWLKNLKGRLSLEDLHIYVHSNDLKWIMKMESLNWIYMAQDSEEWKAVLRFRSPMETVKFLAR